MRVGKAAKVEVLRTEVRISDVEQRLVREQTVLEIQRRALVALMGIDGGNDPVQIQGNLKIEQERAGPEWGPCDGLRGTQRL